MEQEFFLSKGRLGSDKQNALDAIWLGLGRVNAFGHKGGGGNKWQVETRTWRIGW